jgi:Ca2+-binding RTX toxin-like protein
MRRRFDSVEAPKGTVCRCFIEHGRSLQQLVGGRQMAKFTAGQNVGVDFLDFSIKDLGDVGEPTVTTPTTYRLEDMVNGSFNEFHGTGFTYNNDKDLIGGTLNEFFESDPATVGEILRVSDFSMAVTTALKFLDADASQEFLAAIFAGNDTMTGSPFDDQLLGYKGNDTIDGADGNDTLSGDAGNDSLIGGLGDDVMDGGAGNDIYAVDSTLDKVAETGVGRAGGTDTVLSSAAAFILGDNIENLTLVAGKGDIDGTGNSGANVITGNEGNNDLAGEAGNDKLLGAAGDDSLLGGEGNDTLEGGDGNDTIVGGTGKDRMTGGKGDDVYFVDDSGDKISETLKNDKEGGTDTVNSSITFTLGANLDNLVLLAGAGNIKGTGNGEKNAITGNDGDNALAGMAGDDILTGNGGDDLLDGGTGGDTMDGGEGDDIYIQDSALDVIADSGANIGAGDELRTNQDTLTAAIANIEHYTFTGTKAVTFTGDGADNRITGNKAADTLDGGAGHDTLNGMAGNDSLVGGPGDNQLNGGAGNDALVGGDDDDRLDGGTGIDSMEGGAGNDTYVIDNAKDAIKDSGGTDDTIESTLSVDLTKFTGIEHATLLGKSSLSLLGNEFDNELTGNDGANKIDDGEGADKMAGGKGNDTYTVDNVGDTVTEEAGAGIDLVLSSVDFELGDNVENLTLTGDAIEGIGNELANSIVGNSKDNNLAGGDGKDKLTGNDGNDTLDGGTGADSLIGGKGNDTYVVDDAGDRITELSNTTGGIDTVVSSLLSYTLGNYLENLDLAAGAGNINGTGNSSNNEITGNEGDNKLAGLVGNDTLDGGAGDDTLTGGTGNDSLVGGDGADVAVFAGKFADYEITTSGGITTVVDKNKAGGDDGADTIVGVETLQFADKAVSLNNLPVITSDGGSDNAVVPVEENTTAVTTVTATDADAGDELTFSIVGGADQDQFTIDSKTGALSFVSPRDFELPTDAGGDNTYDVIVQASDGKGGIDTQTIAVTVTNANEAPTITSDGGGDNAMVLVEENTTAVTTLTATDVDAGDELTFSLVGGADKSQFTIDSKTGELSFLSPRDFEAPTDAGGDNTYDVVVQVADGKGGVDTQAIAVTITDVDTGMGIDGYIAGATVFADANENGKLDAGEAFTTTDALGRFELAGGSGPILLTGGTDIATGLPFGGTLRAPAGSTVVTPLTTLLVALDEAGSPDPQADLIAALGLTPGTDLTTFDPIAETLAETPGADVAFAAAAQLLNTVAMASATITGASGGSVDQQAANEAVFAALADAIVANAGNPIDLTNGSVISDIVNDANAAAGGDPLDAGVVTSTTNVIAASNTAVGDIVAGGGTPEEVLTQVTAASIVAQDDAAEALADVASGGGTDLTPFTDPTQLEAQIAAAENEVGNATGEIAQGTAAGDAPTLTGGPDAFDGLAGNDTLADLGGFDLLVGGADNDSLDGGADGDQLDGGDGADTVTGGTGNDTSTGGAGVDVYLHSGTIDDGDDVVHTGDDGLDVVIFTTADLYDLDWARDGNDLIVGQYDGGPAPFLDQGTVRIVDHYAGGSVKYVQIDSVYNLDYGTDPDVSTWYFTTDLTAGIDNTETGEILLGTEGGDVINANDGFYDVVDGNGGDDTIDGGAGADNLRGQEGNDSIFGGTGNDSVRGDSGNDTLDGGDGIDRVRYNTASGGVIVNLATGTAEDIDGTGNSGKDKLSNFENVDGSQFNDQLTGDGQDNVLRGRGGSDTIFGAGGDDVINGGFDGVGDEQLSGDAGNDTIFGGSGADTISGGTGDDELSSGGGGDKFLHAVGDGFDTVFGADGSAHVLLTGTDLYDINFDRVGDDLVVSAAIDGDYDFADTGSRRARVLRRPGLERRFGRRHCRP